MCFACLTATLQCTYLLVLSCCLFCHSLCVRWFHSTFKCLIRLWTSWTSHEKKNEKKIEWNNENSNISYTEQARKYVCRIILTRMYIILACAFYKWSIWWVSFLIRNLVDDVVLFFICFASCQPIQNNLHDTQKIAFCRRLLSDWGCQVEFNAKQANEEVKLKINGIWIKIVSFRTGRRCNNWSEIFSLGDLRSHHHQHHHHCFAVNSALCINCLYYTLADFSSDNEWVDSIVKLEIYSAHQKKPTTTTKKCDAVIANILQAIEINVLNFFLLLVVVVAILFCWNHI